ncbi:MAG: dehydrogenase, partial [Thermobispora bispora]|nr:dehydrogenase [Thermobispora bispora]
MTEFRVPKLNNNDATYILVEWLAEDGQEVRDGDPIVVLETSKATEEVEAPEPGVLRRLLPEGTECEPGQVIARLLVPGEDAAAETADGDARGPRAAAPPAAGAGVVVTAPARELIEAHGVPMERVYALGRKVIRRTDVEELLRGDATGADDAADTG